MAALAFVGMVVAVAGVPAGLLTRLIFGPPQEDT
jgi:hypothetical protein